MIRVDLDARAPCTRVKIIQVATRISQHIPHYVYSVELAK